MAVRVSFVQGNIVWNDPIANADYFIRLGSEAARDGAQIVVFPEMFSTGFSFPSGDDARVAESIGLEVLTQLATVHGIVVAGSLPEVLVDHDRPFNTLYLVGPTGVLGKYRKIHLFSHGGESEHYSSGNFPLNLPVEGLRVTCAICYDLRFGPYFYNLAAKTDLYVVVANWPVQRQYHWDTLLRSRAIENQAYVLGVNRLGAGGSLQYAGGSVLLSPFGEDLVNARDEEGVFFGEVEPQVVSELRKNFPILSDRKPEVYDL